MDLTEIYNNNNKIKLAIKKYQTNNENISNVPCILVFEDGKLNKIYNIKENNYNIEKLEDFLEEEGIEIDD